MMFTEERITNYILDYLEENGWKILCFDYPQSGTGIYFKNENLLGNKNKNSINPDIIATKNKISLYFENKSYYYQPDVDLLKKLKILNPYRKSIDRKLLETKNTNFYYGIGLPYTLDNENKIQKLLENKEIDFAALVIDCKKIFWCGFYENN